MKLPGTKGKLGGIRQGKLAGQALTVQQENFVRHKLYFRQFRHSS